MNTRLIAGLICLLGLGGCATKFAYTPVEGVPSATLRITEKVPFVYLTEHAGCPKKMVDQSRPETPIPANTRLWIEPGYSTIGLAYGSECTVPLSFVAEANKEYLLVYRNQGHGCTANILERDQNGTLAINQTTRQEERQRCMW